MARTPRKPQTRTNPDPPERDETGLMGDTGTLLAPDDAIELDLHDDDAPTSRSARGTAETPPPQKREEPEPEKRLPSGAKIERSDAGELDPWDEIWLIVLERNDGTQKDRRWNHVGNFANESFAKWQTDPPLKMVRRVYGPGEYRFRVRFGPDYLRLDAYPYIGGARTFYIDPKEEPKSSKFEDRPTDDVSDRQPQQLPTAPVPSPANGGATLDVNSLVASLVTMLKQPGAQQPSAQQGGGMTAEQIATLTTTAQLALKLDGAIEKLKDDRTAAQLAAVTASAAKDKEYGTLKADTERELLAMKGQIDKLRSDLEAQAKRDPIKDIKSQVALAEALGFEKGGNWIGVAEKFVEIAAPSWFAGRAQQQPQQLPANGAQQQPQLSGSVPQAWRTADDGAWVNVGEWAEWVAAKIRKRQPTSVDLMVDELVSRTLNDERAAQWVKTASLKDLRELFQMVIPPDEVARFPDMTKEGTNLLQAFPLRYDETVAVVRAYEAGQTKAKQEAAAAQEQPQPPRPITVAGRTLPPPPPPPPPPA